MLCRDRRPVSARPRNKTRELPRYGRHRPRSPCLLSLRFTGISFHFASEPQSNEGRAPFFSSSYVMLYVRKRRPMTLHALCLSHSRMLPYALPRPGVQPPGAAPDRLKQELIVYIAHSLTRPLPSAIVIIITSTSYHTQESDSYSVSNSAAILISSIISFVRYHPPNYPYPYPAPRIFPSFQLYDRRPTTESESDGNHF